MFGGFGELGTTLTRPHKGVFLGRLVRRLLQGEEHGMMAEDVQEKGLPPLGQAEHASCPFLKEVEGDWNYPVQGFCTGYSDGRLRIPSIFEIRTLCTCRRYVQCETYRHRLKEEREQAQAA